MGHCWRWRLPTHPPSPPTHPPLPPTVEGPPSATPPANQRDGEVPDGVTRTVFDSLFGYSNGGFGQTFNSGEAAPGGAAAASSHGWAARLRDYCDQVRAALRWAALDYIEPRWAGLRSVCRGALAGAPGRWSVYNRA